MGPSLKKLFSFLNRNRLIAIFLLIFLVSLVSAYIFFLIEARQNDNLNSFGTAVWWVIVSITTVGYGDVAPVTAAGRVLGVLVIFAGVALFSMFTATISSIFVAQKLREDRGLKEISTRNHIVLCGWNHTAEQILQVISKNPVSMPVVLINQLPEDQVQDILSKFQEQQLQYVRGDFTLEEILNRANVSKASAAILIPDNSTGINARSDEKTIFAALTIRSIHPKIKIYAHLLDRDNEPYLKKAQIDDYIISDDFSGVLLGEMVSQPGVPQSVQNMINVDRLGRIAVPNDLIGKTFKDALVSLRAQQLLPIAVVEEKKPLSFSKILSEDYSYLDEFIERKFKEAGRSLRKGAQLDVNINPADETELKQGQYLVVIR